MAFTATASGTAWNGSSCSSYCHGSTLAAGGTATNPNWTKVDGTQSTCTSCHGNPPPSPHPQQSDCSTCHPDAGATAGTFTTPSQHIDGIVQTSNVHPPGYNAVEQHGYDFDKNGQSTCATASCHGVALTGGNSGGPSCNNCHTPGWQTNCIFCHGGTDNTTGAPPAGVLGTLSSPQATGAHSKHVNQTTTHVAWDCTYCHTKPTSALNPGHIDGAGGVVQAEINFSSLNSGSQYSFSTFSCTTSYCHSTVLTSGSSPSWTSTTPLACVNGCHGGATAYTGMSSGHRRSDHKKACSTCHANVVDANNNIISLSLHVNGARDVQFTAAGSSYNAATKTCTKTGSGCHGSGSQSNW
jgi:hypothetical protein